MNHEDMTDCGKLLESIRAMRFALLECSLYLDCHPDDKKALAYYREWEKKYTEAMSRYETACGVMTHRGAATDKEWLWTKEPFPWESGFGETEKMTDGTSSRGED